MGKKNPNILNVKILRDLFIFMTCRSKPGKKKIPEISKEPSKTSISRI
jgi:hypothetical protein